MPQFYSIGSHHAAVSYLMNSALGTSEDQQKKQRFRALILEHDNDDRLEAVGLRTRSLTAQDRPEEEIEIRAVYGVLPGQNQHYILTYIDTQQKYNERSALADVMFSSFNLPQYFPAHAPPAKQFNAVFWVLAALLALLIFALIRARYRRLKTG